VRLVAAGGGVGEAFDEDVGSSLATEGDGVAVGESDGEEVGDRIVAGETEGAAGAQAGVVDEAEKFRVLAGDAGDAGGDAGGKFGKGVGGAGVHAAGGGGDGVAMGIHAGVAEEGVEALDKAVGPSVFEEFGFGVDFGPVEAKGLDEKHFDEAVFAEHAEGEAFASRGEAGTDAGGVAQETGLGEGLDHGGDGAGDNGHGAGEFAHGHGFAGVLLAEQVELLDVVLDGAGGHAGKRMKDEL